MIILNNFNKLISSLILVSVVIVGSLLFTAERAEAAVPVFETNPSVIGSLATISTTNVLIAKDTSALVTKEVGPGGIPSPLSWDNIAWVLVKGVINSMSQSIIDWINTGFDGNPIFITNPEAYFKDLAMEASGIFIEELGMADSPLCEGFRPDISLTLQYRTQPFSSRYKCTIDDVVDNLRAFENDFGAGGWRGWLEMTARPQNNPYSSYMMAADELERRRESAKSRGKMELDWGSGFVSLKECVSNDAAGNCTRWENTTPGDVIANQISQALGSPMRTLEIADELNEAIAGIANALINQLISQGLASLR